MMRRRLREMPRGRESYPELRDDAINAISTRVSRPLPTVVCFGSGGFLMTHVDGNSTANAVMVSGGMIWLAGADTSDKDAILASYSTHGVLLTLTTTAIESGQQASWNRVQETTGGTTSFYLTDTANPTGYAQPIEVWTSTNGSLSSATLNTTYLIGDQVFGQDNSGGTLSYIVVDGNDNTRLLTNGTGMVTNVFNYDAFGDALNF